MIKSLSLAIPKAPVAVAVAAAAVHHHHHHRRPHQLPPPLCLVDNSLRFSARGGNKVCAQQRCRLVRTMASTPPAGGTKVQKSEEEWRTVLNPEQFRILREKGTEWAGTGQYNKHYDEGVYECAACGTPLYKSTTKFDSGCGWPAFFEGLPGAITETPDADGRRTEITCTACGGHLGHVFKGEGFKTPTDARHCVNSISLNFTPANK